MGKTKECTNCHQVKLLFEFYPSKTYKDGRQSICKACSTQKVATYNKNHPDKSKFSARKAQIKQSYGLLYEDWLKLWETQDGKCAICGESFDRPGAANTDHNHKTNKVRGLVCRRCNIGLGYYENTKRMIESINYLRRTE